jgi:hypothetical protein
MCSPVALETRALSGATIRRKLAAEKPRHGLDIRKFAYLIDLHAGIIVDVEPSHHPSSTGTAPFYNVMCYKCSVRAVRAYGSATHGSLSQAASRNH